MVSSSSSPLLFLSILILLLSTSVSGHGGLSDHDDEGTNESSLEAHNLRLRSLILVKLWCLMIIFVVTFCGGISPYFLKWNEGFLVLGTQFSGGVFLGTAMMHFLSDSVEVFGDLTSKKYPFGFMLASCGYLMTMFADCVIQSSYRKRRAENEDLDERGTLSQEKSNSNGETSLSRSHNQADHVPEIHLLPSLVDASSLGDSILLIISLCFHSIFEGIAIGISVTTREAWKTLWTVSLHKIFAAIAMGIALLRMIPGRPLLSCIAYAFAFAISTPIGVAIGIVIDTTTEGSTADWIYAISMGLACGIFIFVSVNHLLAKGYLPQKPSQVLVDHPFYKFSAVALGIGIIAIVMIWDT